MIEISAYADINVPDVWTGGRNPVAYMTLGDFGLNLADLEFHSLPTPSMQVAEDAPAGHKDPIHEDDGSSDDVVSLTINQAKRGLAASFGVDIDSIEIVIRA